MQRNKTQVIEDLDKDLSAIYSLFADEAIQLIDLADQIIHKAKFDGFTEKETHVVTKDVDWSFLESKNENFDLFGSKKIIEIKLLGIGPGNKGSKALKEYCVNPDSNKLLIVTGEGLEKKQLNSAWAKALEENGVMVVEPVLNKNSMVGWVEYKASSLNLNIDSQAIRLICEKNEGNLNGTVQELMKLSLLFPNQKISIEDLKKSIADGSKFGIFDLSNVFLNGDKKKTIKIIESLRAEGVQPPLLLWALSREIYNLYKVVEEGNTKSIYGPKYYQDLLSKRANEISIRKIKSGLKDIAEIDSSIKGLSDKSPWQSIRELAVKF